MTKVNIITPPDKLFNRSFSVLLISPRKELLQEIQDQVLPFWEFTSNLYYYDKEIYNKNDTNWLLDVFNLSDLTLLDIDNSPIYIRNLSSFFISYEKTYWLTNDQNPVYNHLSNNRIYNAQFMLDIGGKIGKKAY